MDKAYKDYINSSAWKRKRQEYFESELPQNCWSCNKPREEINHRHYANLFNERVEDLNAFCTKCHQAWTHFYKKNTGKPQAFRYEVGNDWIRLQRKNNGLKPLPDSLFEPIKRNKDISTNNAKLGKADTLCPTKTVKNRQCKVILDARGRCHIHSRKRYLNRLIA